MSFAEWKEFWWNSITGPHAMVTKTVDLLLDKNTVVLIVPEDLPWRHEMRSAVEAAFKLKAEGSDTMIHQADAADDCPPDTEPGKYLLQRFAPPEIRQAFREKAGIPLQTYMLKNAVLKNAIVWVKGLTPTQAGAWMKFCRGYAPSATEDGLIILEIQGDMPVSDTRRIKTVALSDFISNYDLQLFNSFILDDASGYTETWKRYISAVGAHLCEADAEVSETLVREIDFRSEEPLAGLQMISDSAAFERRGRENSRHVLARCRAGDVDELNKRIWSAQVQILFPLIEFERMEIINSQSGEIQRGLDTYEITQYNQRIAAPLDMELGTLVYNFSHRADAYNYYIYIPDDAVRERIRFLHACRNTLAHVKSLSVRQVSALIERTAGVLA
jgi:hypothetical protein